ncbi:lysozyme inhibitor LprI family protein [Xanthobacter oligotrophicus]|uniref:Lysozyme inhibitor LprI family protein n=1 Tax=Xanthobacter oligotrophicus TaxID=2607286 RepID=A0ABW6ZVZ5_9HYPH
MAARTARGRWLGLAVLALALSPLVMLAIAPPPDPPVPPGLSQPAPFDAPAGAPLSAPASGPEADEAAPEVPVAPKPAADPVRAAAPVRRGTPTGPERWAGTPACPKDRISGGQYNRCLFEATRTSEQALEVELSNAFAVIEARADLQGVQRARWKTMLDEAQSRFLLYRNFDCQSVAPFEGPRGIGNFEQRALCLIEANMRRAGELRARYVATVATTTERTRPNGPEDRPGTWTHPVPPAAD